MREKEPTNGISVHAGFPNPALDSEQGRTAADKTLGNLDLNRLLIQNSAGTFLFRLRGNEWEPLGIFDNDIAIVNRALDPRKNDLVIWWDEDVDDFAISKRKDVKSGANIWGVVTAVIHQFRKRGVDH